MSRKWSVLVLAFLFLLVTGSMMRSLAQSSGARVRTLADFADGTVRPFTPGPNVQAVREHAPGGGYALRLDRDYVLWEVPQDWTGDDFFEADVFNAAEEPTQLYFEVQDLGTTDYWTRVNYTTVLPPGASTLIIPTDLYVGEKSRPGRALDRAHIKRVALNIGAAKAPVFFARLRLAHDDSDRVRV